MYDSEGAIGIFDSGVGGLTVVRQIALRLPQEDVVYLGDTARVPYGTKSGETVVRYALSCAQILLKRRIKLLVVACNTASAFALDTLRDRLEVPVVGVVEPGARAALEITETMKIGVIGTRGTIASGEYRHTLEKLAPEVQVFSKACPLFVPLAEEGWTVEAEWYDDTGKFHPRQASCSRCTDARRPSKAGKEGLSCRGVSANGDHRSG